MQLLIIGLILLVSLLIYYIYVYFTSSDRIAPNAKSVHKKSSSESGKKVLYFPSDKDVEKEKKKHHID